MRLTILGFYQYPEFIFRALDAWAYFNKVKLDYSRPGTPTDNSHIESFNGSFRDECLNMNWFMSLEDARDKVERWRRDYNEFRPHSALTYLTPAEFARISGSEAVYTSIFSRSDWTTILGIPQISSLLTLLLDHNSGADQYHFLALSHIKIPPASLETWGL